MCFDPHVLARPAQSAPCRIDPVPCESLSRRRFLVTMAGGDGVALAGCAGGGTGLGFNMVSDEEVRALGVKSWQELRAKTPVSANAEYPAALERVAGRLLVAAGENPAAWEAVVFQGSSANAFALPGNKIGVFEGLFRYARSEAQLAAVVGHEIAHNQRNHAQERVSSAMATNIGVQIIGLALGAGGVGGASTIAGLLGAGAEYGVILPFSRNQELEADRLGLINMARAGYDPRAAIQLWINMERAGGPRGPSWLSTHPAPGDRIARLEAMMPEAMAVYQSSAR